METWYAIDVALEITLLQIALMCPTASFARKKLITQAEPIMITLPERPKGEVQREEARPTQAKSKK